MHEPSIPEHLRHQRQRILDELIEAAGHGREYLVPILGPSLTPRQRDIGTKFVEKLAENGYPFATRYDLARASQYHATLTSFGKLKQDFAAHVTSEIQPGVGPREELELIYRTLARLPLPTYLTAGVDDSMERALTECRRRPTSDVCLYSHELRKRFPSGRTKPSQPEVATPLVYHLFGRLDLRESVVLAEDEYLEWLISASALCEGNHRGQLMPPAVVKALSSTCLLFIGFTLEDWSLRVLLKIIRALAPDNGPHTCLLLYPRPGENEWDLEEHAYNYLKGVFDKNRLLIWPPPLADFAQEFDRAIDKAIQENRIRRYGG